jgi:iron complex outermembrane receptor protein
VAYKSAVFGGCAFLAIVGGLAAPAMAEEASASPARASTIENEGDIIVTARRRDETVQNTPVPMTVLNEAILDRFAIRGVAEIATLTPGMFTGEASGSVGGSISLRGIGSGDSQPSSTKSFRSTLTACRSAQPSSCAPRSLT